MAHRLFIKTSNLPGAGKGLFTRDAISKNERIVEYKGRLVLWRDIKHLDGINGYILRVSRSMAINAESSVTLGRYANDAAGAVRLAGVRNNAEYVSDGNRCFIEALRPIAKGEEIFVGYGKEYWLLMKKLWGNPGERPQTSGI